MSAFAIIQSFGAESYLHVGNTFVLGLSSSTIRRHDRLTTHEYRKGCAITALHISVSVQSPNQRCLYKILSQTEISSPHRIQRCFYTTDHHSEIVNNLRRSFH